MGLNWLDMIRKDHYTIDEIGGKKWQEKMWA